MILIENVTRQKNTIDHNIWIVDLHAERELVSKKLFTTTNDIQVISPGIKKNDFYLGLGTSKLFIRLHVTSAQTLTSRTVIPVSAPLI